MLSNTEILEKTKTPCLKQIKKINSLIIILTKLKLNLVMTKSLYWNVVYVKGSGQNCKSVQNCTWTKSCMKTLLHEGIKLYKDIIARRHFCTKTLLLEQTILHGDVLALFF